MAAVNGNTNTNGINGVNGHINGVNGHVNGGSPRAETQGRPRNGVGPDNYPRLPPINRPVKPRDDPYANSKLMTFRLANHKQALLMQVL